MSEFSAFLTGLILGDSTPMPRIPNKKPLHSNVALQDIAFCQALRNAIDGLESYVSTQHPTPEEFIRHILPEENFDEPLTSEERSVAVANQKKTDAYVRWIKAELASTGENWDELPAIKMVWRDITHTPDIDHLDLLLGDALQTPPLKINGRVYEYKTTVPLHGLAKDFFLSIPAKIILSACLQFAQGEVSRYDFKFDFSRFEYNAKADKANALQEWKQQRRTEQYIWLATEHPETYHTAWSDYTRMVFAAMHQPQDEQHTQRSTKPSKDERRRRVEERNKIFAALTPEEKGAFKQMSLSRLSPIRVVAPIICIILCAVALVVGFCLMSADADLEMRGIFGLILLSASFAGIFPSSLWMWHDYSCIPHLKRMQSAYYSDDESPLAREYSRLLSKITK